VHIGVAPWLRLIGIGASAPDFGVALPLNPQERLNRRNARMAAVRLLATWSGRAQPFPSTLPIEPQPVRMAFVLLLLLLVALGAAHLLVQRDRCLAQLA
jgi:hypothetical protein